MIFLIAEEKSSQSEKPHFSHCLGEKNRRFVSCSSKEEM